MGYIYGWYGGSINIVRFDMKRLSKQDIIYSLVLLVVGMLVGWYVRGGCDVDTYEEHKEMTKETPIKGWYDNSSGMVVIEYDHGGRNK